MSEKLVQACRMSADAARQAVAWFDRNADTVGGQLPALRRAFRTHERELRKLAKAAELPSSIGIFGPSQVGKSYLVSALAAKKGEPLITRIGNRGVDFIREINPPGGGNEATGLVTRFTVNPPAHPAGKPVTIRLLSQVDLVKIIINTFMNDLVQAIENPPTDNEVLQALKEAESRMASVPVDPLTDLDISDIREYMRNNFAGRETVKVLERTGFWERLEEIAPRLELEDRLRVFSLMWGRLDLFTDLYRNLYSALARLGFPETGWCSEEALIPRSTSIIDVERLLHLMADEGDTIEVQADNGQTARLPRSILSALASELIIPLLEAPWQFLEHTDLLDFPGARSRLEISNLEKVLSENESIGTLFLRGKIAYLFERYRSEYDLTTLLLCIKPGNQEVRGIDSLITPWVHSTQGRTPEERAQAQTTLFFISTQFDRHFEQSGGRPENTDEIWTKLIRECLIKLLGVNDRWVEEWTPGQPFNNVFFGRSPGIRTTLMTYETLPDGRLKETGLADPEFVEKVKQDFLANELIRKHVAEPEKAWEAALSLNDGGGTYIAEKLCGTCRPELKENQVKARLLQIVRDMIASLSDFYVSTDSEEERRKRLQAARETILALGNAVKAQKISQMFDFLSVQPASLLQTIKTIDLNEEEEGETEGPLIDIEDEIKEILDEFIDMSDLSQEETPSSTARPATPTKEDFHDRIAKAIITHWHSHLADKAKDEKVRSYLGISADALNNVVRELQTGVRIFELQEKIAGLSRKYATDIADRNPNTFYKAALPAAHLLNTYVLSAGQLLLPEEDRMRRKTDGRPLFSTVHRAESVDDVRLGEEPRVKQFFLDWAVAYMKLVEGNTQGGLPRDFDIKENEHLGRIIETLKTQQISV